MRKNGSRVLALLLSVGMVVSAVSWDLSSYALTYIGNSEVKYADESPTGNTVKVKATENNQQWGNQYSNKTTEITVEGGNVTKTGIQKMIDQSLEDYNNDNPAGDVRLIINPANLGRTIINNSLNDITYINVPTDKGISSFTITTTKEGATKDDPVILFVEMGSTANIYSNGVPLFIEGAISVGGTIYGGGESPVNGDTYISYDGATAGYNRTVIYGGGHNSNINGSTNIDVKSTHAKYNNGVTFSVIGGGCTDVEGETANIGQNTNINIYGPVINATGGGDADSASTANVAGDTNIVFHPGSSLLRKVYGGGQAYNYYDNANTVSYANVVGSSKITILSDIAQDRYDGDYIVGGGYATIGANTTAALSNSSAIADVGNVVIEVDGNVSTNTEVNTNRCIVGGGDIDGRVHGNPDAAEGMDICQANVNGDVTIKIAGDSSLNNGIIGGGSAFGGTCEVSGKIDINIGDNVTIDKGSAGGGIIGGGYINGNSYGASSVDAGSVNITIGSNVNMKGDFTAGGLPSPNYYDNTGSHADVEGSVTTKIGNSFVCGGIFVGGGYSRIAEASAKVGGRISTSIGDDSKIAGNFIGAGCANKTDADVSVSGDVTTAIGNRAALSSWFYGGGVGWQNNTKAIVGGSISTTIGDECKISNQYIGGGGAEAENADASVSGDINTNLGDSFSCSYFTSAGRTVTGTNSIATTGSSSAPAKVTTAFKGNGSNVVSYTGFIVGAGRAYAADSDATVFGDTKIVFDGTVPGNNVYGGGYATSSGIAKVTGTVTTEAKNITGKVEKYFYGGGNSDGAQAITDIGSAVMNFADNKNLVNFIFGGGSANSKITNSTAITLSYCNLSGGIYGGGWGNAGGSAVSEGPVSLIFNDSTVSTVNAGGFTNAVINGKVTIMSNNATISTINGGGDENTVTSETVNINLTNSDVDTVKSSGTHASSQVKETILTLLGTTGLGHTDPGTGIKTNGITVNIGDGKVKTDAKISYIYDNSVPKVHVNDFATLTHAANGNKLLWYTKDLQLDKGGKLVLAAYDESISGDFVGGGTLVTNADNIFSVGGTVSNDTVLEIAGNPTVGQTYVTENIRGDGNFLYATGELSLKKIDSGTGSAWKIISAHKITASADGGHGKISPEGDISVSPGGKQTFTFEPDDGYKVDVVKVDGQEVEVSGNTYTFENVDQDHTLTVSFDLMKHEDVEDAIENLNPSDPGVDPPKEDVLDVKIAYESLPEEEKELVKDEALKELNDQLANLSEIEIKLETHSTLESKVNAENLSSMVDAITKEEARKLKEGDIDKITLKLLVTTADTSDEKIKENETEHTIGMHMDISVLKIVGSSGKEEKVESTKLPIRMVFDIPQELQGKNRQFFLLHKHDGSVEALPDLDQEETTLTAESSRFSPYAIAYRETGGQDPTPTPPHNTGPYTIKTSHTTGGTISPSGHITVKAGKEITFAMTPKKGYVIQDVIVDGQSIGAVKKYTFKTVQKAHTIKVVFTRDIASVDKIKLQANSSLTKKNHIYVKWKAVKGSLAGLDGYEVFRSTKRNSGYGKTPFFQTKNTHYTNSKSLKKGTRYYYKVRGYVKAKGKRYYTSWSSKAYRAVPIRKR